MLTTLLLTLSLALAEDPASAGADLAAPAAEGEVTASPEEVADLKRSLPTDPAELRAALKAQLAVEGLPAEAADQLVEAVATRLELERSLHPTSGDVTVGDDLATLHLADAYQFVGPEDAVKVLVAWGNPPPSTPPLGLIWPAGASLFEDGSWAVFVEYDDQGHVDDADAKDIDYDALLKEIQQAQVDENPARIEAGYDALEIVGWAEPPHYDADAKKLYWAKHLRWEGGESLNYDIRVLGRRGVLQLAAVSGMDRLDDVRTGMQDVLPRVAFNQGETYADFDPSVDKVAAAGIAALIAGKVAAKAGLFKLLIAGLVAGKKLIVAGAVAVAAAVRGLLGKKNPPTPPAA
jgi:uncharacterized membrane-anchored protein